VRIIEIYESPLISVASCKFDNLKSIVLKSSNVSDSRASRASRASLVALELSGLALSHPIP
jgi:hypothetical protein